MLFFVYSQFCFKYSLFFLHKKTPCLIKTGCFRNNELAMTYSHMGNPTLPSAQRGFTSEFGKGSGGSLLLLSPAQLFMITRYGLNYVAYASLCLALVKRVINRMLFELNCMF